jgi:hypothetical protein
MQTGVLRIEYRLRRPDILITFFLKFQIGPYGNSCAGFFLQKIRYFAASRLLMGRIKKPVQWCNQGIFLL